MGKSERDIKKTCPGATVKGGLPITGSMAGESKETLKSWLKANGRIHVACTKPEWCPGNSPGYG